MFKSLSLIIYFLEKQLHDSRSNNKWFPKTVVYGKSSLKGKQNNQAMILVTEKFILIWLKSQ